MRLTNVMRDAFVRAVMNDVPSVDYSTQFQDAATKITVAALPSSVRKVWDDKATREYVKTVNPFRYIVGPNAHVPGFDEEALKKILSVEYEKTKRLQESQDEHRRELRQRVKAAAYSVRTRKALVDILPEFEKYLPADQAAANRQLPTVANLVADLSKAGWPKDKK